MSDPGRPRVHAPEELTNLLLDPGWVDAANALCLVVDVEAKHGDPAPFALRERLDALPIPTIGFASDQPGPVAEGVDVTVHGEEVLDTVLGRTRANPTASSVLVQVLRSIELPALQALAVESLAWRKRPSRAQICRCGGFGCSAVGPVGLAAANRALNAPHNRNALSTAVRDGLTEAFRLVAMDPGIERATCARISHP